MKKLFLFFNGRESLTTTGFSLIELLTVVAILGIVAAIAAPSWQLFTDYQRLNASTDRILRAMQEAKGNAKRDKLTWQTSFREIQNNNKPVTQLAIHPANIAPEQLNQALWQSLDGQVRIVSSAINSTDSNDTTLYRSSSGVWRMQFNYHGNANGQLGRITLTTRHRSNSKRCVFISTLIGNIRTASDRSCSQ